MSWSPCEAPRSDEARPETVDLVLHPKTKDIGAFSVRRALPGRERRSVGPFVFFYEMGPAELGPDQAMDVRPHPHINLATITYLFEGAIQHRDSLGSDLVIEPGAVNLMVAGRGIVHSERTPQALRGHPGRMHGLQLWIALPDEHEETEPAFHHHPASTLPAWREGGSSVRLLMGRWGEHRSPVQTFSETLYAVLDFDPGARFHLPDAPERGLYVIDGALDIGAQRFEAGNMVVLGAGADVAPNAPDGARCALIGGASVGPRFIEWNFVSSRRERIEAAKADWQAERFPVVPGDEVERIPLPTD